MKIAVSSLRPGISFTKPVYIEDDNLLVPAGIAVRKRDIQHLTSWGIYSVETEGEIIQPRLERTSSLSRESGPPAPAAGGGARGDALADALAKDSAARNYLEIIGSLEGIFERILTGGQAQAKEIDGLAGRVLQAVQEQKGRIIECVLTRDGASLAQSSVNIAILAARTALAMRLPPKKLGELVTAALLHDAGLPKLHRLVLQKPGELTGEEFSLLQIHVSTSSRIITRELHYPHEVGLIAWQHHERWDGRGHPKKLAGSQIDIAARILSAADAFESFAREKIRRNTLIGHYAMVYLMTNHSRRFDPDTVKAFIRAIAIYPPGALVVLSNDARGRVMEIRAAAPLRPRVRVMKDQGGRVYTGGDGPLIDLAEEKTLHIASIEEFPPAAPGG